MHVPILLTPRKHNQVHNMLIVPTIKSVHYHKIDTNLITWTILVTLMCLSVDEKINEIGFLTLSEIES